jgi:sporulation protein YqfC
MLRRKGKLQFLGRILEIPQEIIWDLPRTTTLGNKQLLVENHKGIIEYTPSLVRMKVTQGEITIKGKTLSIGNLQAEQILVEGVIQEVFYDF